jgi:type III restriction enzyme
MFSPDFFIKQGNNVFVVEIKGDEEIQDPAVENVKKHEYARQHFGRLNEWLKSAGLDSRYHFNMLSPKDFLTFFTKLRERELEGFRSQVDVAVAGSGKILQ